MPPARSTTAAMMTISIVRVRLDLLLAEGGTAYVCCGAYALGACCGVWVLGAH